MMKAVLDAGVSDLMPGVLPVVRRTAKFIKSSFGQVKRDEIEEKELNSLVSYVDKEAEKHLVTGLGSLLPGAGFLTEEDTDDTNPSNLRWIIDPLDGTTNFLNDVPHFAISVALEIDGKVVLGMIKEVNSGEEWTAIRGEGAFLNDQPIQVTDKPLSEVLIGTGFPYENDHDYDGAFLVLKEWLTRSRGMRRMGSAALDLVYVASGRFGAFYESTLNAWDVAAGALIVEEAGGLVSDYYGKDDYLFGGTIVAAPAHIHKIMIDEIQKGFRL